MALSLSLSLLSEAVSSLSPPPLKPPALTAEAQIKARLPEFRPLRGSELRPGLARDLPGLVHRQVLAKAGPKPPNPGFCFPGSAGRGFQTLNAEQRAARSSGGVLQLPAPRQPGQQRLAARATKLETPRLSPGTGAALPKKGFREKGRGAM